MNSNRSFLFGEEAIRRWTQGWPRRLVIAVGLVATVAVGWADYGVAQVFGYGFVVTAFYLVPIGLVAFVAGTRAGTIVAFAAAATEAIALRGALVDERNAWAIPISVVLELIVFVAAAYSHGALRRLVQIERQVSRHDALTGVSNVLGFREAVASELARARRWPQVLSLIYLDVDGFKAVNDRDGHARGDEALRIVGVALKRSLRECDVVARVGGDEFAALMPGTGPDGCQAAVGRAQLAIASDLAHAGFRLTVSVGAVTFPSTPDGIDEMLAAADAAMYVVKRAAKNGVHHVVAKVVERRPPALNRADGHAPGS